MVTVILLLFVGLVPCFQAADPVYSPQTLLDSAGNKADNSSTITWADLPSGQPYLVSNPSRDTAGLEPYYKLMHSFINSVFMKGFPDEIIEKAIDGEYTYVINNYSSYITYFLGFAICVALGILFIIIFPIVGCCFCCCRLCGKCGGKRQQLQKDADNTCRKYTFICILFVSTTFVLVGSICIYVNNNNMTTTLNSIPDITENNLADIKTYTNNTVQEATHIISTNFQFVKSALFRDLDNVAYLAGLPLKTNIKDNTNLGATLTSAYSLASSVDALDASLTSVESNLTALNTSITELDTSLNAVKTSLDNIFTTCGGLCIMTGKPNYSSASLDIDTSTFPDLSSARTNMNDARATNLTAKIVDAEKELDDISNTVATEANSTINTMKTTINDLSDNLDGILNQITNINSMLSGSNATVDLDKYSNMVKDAKNTIEKYDKYRWYGGVALSSLTLLVVVFVVLGLVFGIFGTSVSTPTHQRGCVSNCGGTFLIASVALVFIFSSLLMLLTTVPFIPGAPIHKVVCEPITHLELLQKYFNMYEKRQVGEGKYWLAKMILSNDTIPLTLTGVLQDCKDGKAVFTAFKLDSKFDMTDMLNYSKTLNVQSEIDGVNVDLSSITVYPTSLKTQLADVKDAVNINFAQFYTELGANVTTVNLSALANELDTYASGIPDPYKTNIKAEAAKLRNIEAAEYAYVKTNVTALNTSLSEMETTVSSIPAAVDALDSGLTAADNYIRNNASTVVKSILTTFADRLLGIIDSFIAYTEYAVKNQLGSCEPVWNIYNSLLVHTFCYNFMDCLNGFWFSIGWVVFFFLPSVIFSVKAAKYFRQTEMPSEDDHPPPYPGGEKYPQEEFIKSKLIQLENAKLKFEERFNLKYPPVFTSQQPMPSKVQFWIRNNKVGHKDSLEGCGTSTIDPVFGQQSINVSTKVPPNLYRHSDHVDEKEDFHINMTPYGVSAMENETVDPNPTTKSLLNLNQNELTNPEPLEHLEQLTGLNDNQSVREHLDQSVEDTAKASNTTTETELETNQNHELNESNKNENLTDFKEFYPNTLIVSEAALMNTFENIVSADEKEKSVTGEAKKTETELEINQTHELNESNTNENLTDFNEIYPNTLIVSEAALINTFENIALANKKEECVTEEVKEINEKELSVTEELKEAVRKEESVTDEVKDANEKEESGTDDVKEAVEKVESVSEKRKEEKEVNVTEEVKEADKKEVSVTEEVKAAGVKEESVTEETKETDEKEESFTNENVKKIIKKKKM